LVDNQESWDYVVRRNREIDSWRRGKVAARREMALPIVEREELLVELWEADRREARERLVVRAAKLIASGSLRGKQHQQLAAFIAWMHREYGARYDESLGISRAAYDKWLQRSRALLLREGADPEDIRKWSKGYGETRPVARGLRTVMRELKND
jgi:hypothetical protein